MNLREFMGTYRQKYRIVLILQGNQAFWFRWSGKELLDSFVEPLFSELSGRQSRCPWLAENPLDSEWAIELILNTSLDELDRVNVDKHTSRLVQRIQCKTLIRKLSADFPNASINALPDYLETGCASILHHVIPEDWSEWLQLLQAQAVTITHVTTATELLCRWSGQTYCLRLVVQDLGSEMRHLLLDGSIPIYMRVVQKEADTSHATREESNAQSIGQTLAYLSQNVLPVDRLPVVTQLRQHCSAPSPEFAATRLLSALYLDQSTELIEEKMDPVALQDGSTGSAVPNAAVAPALKMAPIAIHRVAKRLWNRVTRTACNHVWRLSSHSRIAKELLLASQQKNRQRNRIVRLQRATILCASMATVTAAVASVHGFTSSRERHQLNTEKAQLRSNIGSLSQTVMAIHLAPLFIANSLERINRHKSVESPDPETIMSTIAQALTHFPEVTLNGLTWAVVEENDFLDQTMTSIAGVTARERLWSDVTAQAQIQLELSGTVDSSGNLREKQSTVDSFVSYLEGVPGIRFVSLLDSPVEAARSSADLVDSVSSYRVAVLLGAL